MAPTTESLNTLVPEDLHSLVNPPPDPLVVEDPLASDEVPVPPPSNNDAPTAPAAPPPPAVPVVLRGPKTYRYADLPPHDHPTHLQTPKFQFGVPATEDEIGEYLNHTNTGIVRARPRR